MSTPVLVLARGTKSHLQFRLLLLLLAATALFIACGSDPTTPTPGPLERGIAAMEVTSPAFHDGEAIPTEYTCEGEDISPPINVGAVPPQTRSLALIMDDPDATSGTFVHWLAFNLDPGRHELKEGLGREGNEIDEGRHGVNGFGRHAYGGPCPPPGETHTYRFMLYALDRALDLEAGATVTELLTAMRGQVLGLGILEGTYARSR